MPLVFAGLIVVAIMGVVHVRDRSPCSSAASPAGRSAPMSAPAEACEGHSGGRATPICSKMPRGAPPGTGSGRISTIRSPATL